MKKILFVALILSCFVLPSITLADPSPMQTIEKHVNEVMAILQEGSKDDKSILKRKKDEIRSIANQMFDYIELSKRTLGRNWKKLNIEQRREFVTLYRDLLESVYMDRILAYKDEKVEFSREKLFSDTKAEVQSKVVAPSGNIPIVYRMILKKNNWKVYDVIIEGVSLIKNYRTQFNDILAKKSPDELLKTLREKVSS